MRKQNREPEYVLSPLQTPVKNYGVYKMNPIERVSVSIALFLLGAVVGYVFYGDMFKVEGVATAKTYISNTVIMGMFGLLSYLIFLPVWIKRQIRKQKVELRSQFRNFLEAFVASLSSGKNTSLSICETYEDLKLQYGEESFICKEVQEILSAEKNGVHIEQMFRSLGERSGIEDIVDFGDVFEISYEKGANLKEVARKTYDIINEKMVIEDEIETKLTSNKIQLNIMMGMPVLVVGMLRFTNESFANNFATPSGVLAMTSGVVCMIAAFLLGRKIISIGGK